MGASSTRTSGSMSSITKGSLRSVWCQRRPNVRANRLAGGRLMCTRRIARMRTRGRGIASSSDLREGQPDATLANAVLGNPLQRHSTDALPSRVGFESVSAQNGRTDEPTDIISQTDEGKEERRGGEGGGEVEILRPCGHIHLPRPRTGTEAPSDLALDSLWSNARE